MGVGMFVGEIYSPDSGACANVEDAVELLVFWDGSSK
jgi:hypothetical protein